MSEVWAENTMCDKWQRGTAYVYIVAGYIGGEWNQPIVF